jgi:hypothetical protein
VRAWAGWVTALQSGGLLLLTGWNYSACSLRQGLLGRRLLIRRRRCASKLRPDAITGPKLCAPDRSDKFTAHRFSRLNLSQRLVADFGRCILRERACRKTDCGEDKQNPYHYFPFAFSPISSDGLIERPNWTDLFRTDAVDRFKLPPMVSIDNEVEAS